MRKRDPWMQQALDRVAALTAREEELLLARFKANLARARNPDEYELYARRHANETGHDVETMRRSPGAPLECFRCGVLPEVFA